MTPDELRTRAEAEAYKQQEKRKAFNAGRDGFGGGAYEITHPIEFQQGRNSRAPEIEVVQPHRNSSGTSRRTIWRLVFAFFGTYPVASMLTAADFIRAAIPEEGVVPVFFLVVCFLISYAVVSLPRLIFLAVGK